MYRFPQFEHGVVVGGVGFGPEFVVEFGEERVA